MISSTLNAQDKKISSFKTSYDEHLNKISASNKVRTSIETAKTELEATMNTKLERLKAETKSDNKTKFNSLNMKLSYLTSKDLLPMTKLMMISSIGHSSSHLKNLHMDQNLPKFIFHDPRRRHTSSDSKMVRCHNFFLLTIIVNKNIYPSYKYLTSLNHNISFFMIPPDTYPKFATTK